MVKKVLLLCLPCVVGHGRVKLLSSQRQVAHGVNQCISPISGLAFIDADWERPLLSSSVSMRLVDYRTVGNLMTVAYSINEIACCIVFDGVDLYPIEDCSFCFLASTLEFYRH